MNFKNDLYSLHCFHWTIFFQNIILYTIVQWCNWVLRHEALSSNLFEKITCHFFYKRAAWSDSMHNDVKCFLTKGQIISKGLFGVVEFSQNTNERIRHSSKNKFVRLFVSWENSRILKVLSKLSDPLSIQYFLYVSVFTFNFWLRAMLLFFREYIFYSTPMFKFGACLDSGRGWDTSPQFFDR